MADPYDQATCEKNIEEGYHIPACNKVSGDLAHHCEGVAQTLHDMCVHVGSNFPIQTTYCQFSNGDIKYYPDSRDPAGDCIAAGGSVHSCGCCCACMAHGTMIRLPEGGMERIETVAKGEQVLSGSFDPGGALVWAPAPVTFSNGTGGGDSHFTVHLSFGHQDGPTGEFVCSPDQPVVLFDGKLVQASQLHVRDRLMSADGTAVAVRSVAIGEYRGGFHHLGVGRSADPEGGHLLQAAGLVVGDYYLQLRPKLMADRWTRDAAERPHIWDPAYARAHGAEKHQASFVFGTSGCGGEAVAGQEGTFTVYSDTNDHLQDDVAKFLTPKQADDVLRNGKQTSIGNPIPKFMVETVFKHLRGFYPDVDLYLDWNRIEPNVYALRRFGRNTVVVTGGLARSGVLRFEGMVMAVAHGANRFSGAEPLDSRGFTVTGRADYDAFQGISRTFWWDDAWLPAVSAAQEQFDALFDLVSEENAKGNPAAGFDEPSLACRRSCIAYSSILGFPECAGGPPLTRIALEDAAATADVLTLAVNLTPDPDTVTPPGNYAITPAVTITEARIDANSPFHIQVTAEFKVDHEYQVTVHGLASEIGTGVDPEHDTLRFTPRAPAIER